MGLKFLPEEKAAKKIFLENNLSVPFDLEALVSKYARLSFESIPIDGIDGVSIYLKTSKTHIIVNTRLSKKRQTFTLAHELGHVILPWHVGTIIDDIYSQPYKDFAYFEIEQEANRFAAELLMPTFWVLECCENYGNLANLHTEIADVANVSMQAAAIRLIQLLPPDIVFAAEQNGMVLHSGRTIDTSAFPQKVDTIFDSKFYPHIDDYSTSVSGSVTYHWWKISTSIKIDVDQNISWREILDKIISDINPLEGAKKFKMSINGIFGSAHSVIKRNGKNYNVENLTSVCLHKMLRPELRDFTSHPDFSKFIKRRVMDFFP